MNHLFVFLFWPLSPFLSFSTRHSSFRSHRVLPRKGLNETNTVILDGNLQQRTTPKLNPKLQGINTCRQAGRMAGRQLGSRHRQCCMRCSMRGDNENQVRCDLIHAAPDGRSRQPDTHKHTARRDEIRRVAPIGNPHQPACFRLGSDADNRIVADP